MNIHLIACIDQNNGIGKDNDLLFKIKEDLAMFRKLTTDNVVVMGRKTFESLPNGPLKYRTNVVISSTMGLVDGVILYRSLDDFFMGAKYHPEIKDKTIFVIGGGQIYEQFIKSANTLDITKVYASKPADTFFPEIDPKVWDMKLTCLNDTGEIPYEFITYERKIPL